MDLKSVPRIKENNMSGISPDSNIKIYKNVPLDNTYNHTLYFANVTAQNAYFHGTASVQHSLTAQSYQRVRKGAMRIAVNAESLYTCNYLAFQNHAYGTKWFYAFITSVEYINDTTSEVTFEIDVMQTYFFDVTLKQCFVEREHSEQDDLFGNIQPEPVSLGEYVDDVDNGVLGQYHSDNPVIIVAKSADSTHQGNVYDGIFSGAQLYAFNYSDMASIVSFLDSYINQPDEILSIYMVPKQLYPWVIPTGGTPLGGNVQASTESGFSITTCYGTEDFDGYTPKNKKLYTYPYNFVRIDNNCGQSLNLRFEFGTYGTLYYELTGTLTQPVKMVLRPMYYKNRSVSRSESITIDGIPACSWNIDAYKQWVAQNSIPLALQTVAGVGTSAIAAAFSAHPIGALATGVIGTVAHVLSQNYEASIAADQCRGNLANSNVNFAKGTLQFYWTRTHITKEYAKVIDDFFTMFGYATNRVKYPNRSARSRWNYTKTVGCVVVGNAPAEDVKTICQIYDNGITFWKNASEVGNYSLSNDVPSP